MRQLDSLIAAAGHVTQPITDISARLRDRVLLP